MSASQHLEDYLNQLAPAVKRVRFAGLVGGFGLVGVGNWFRSSEVAWLAEHSDLIFWTGLVVLLLTNFLLVFIDKQSVETLKSLHQEEERSSALREEVRSYERSERALLAWLGLTKLLSELVDQALSHDDLDREAEMRLFDAAVEFIAEHRLRLFGIEDDYLNISIYEFSDAGLLACVACYRSRPSDSAGPHREWRPGEGHVGKAFELQTELVCADARAPDVAAWIAAPPDKVHGTDTERYVSLAAIPIAVDAGHPLGVVIMTSDQPYRFVNASQASNASDEYLRQGRYAVEALQDIAAQLAQLMCILQANRAKAPNHGGDPDDHVKP